MPIGDKKAHMEEDVNHPDQIITETISCIDLNPIHLCLILFPPSDPMLELKKEKVEEGKHAVMVVGMAHKGIVTKNVRCHLRNSYWILITKCYR